MTQQAALEVVNHHDGLHKAPEDYGPEVYHHWGQAPFEWSSAHGFELEKKIEDDQNHNKIICGIRRRKFWIAIGVLAILAIVGLIVGFAAAMAMKRPTKTAPPSGQTTTTALASPTSTALALETIVADSQTIVRDCPSSNGTQYTAGTSPPQKFLKRCSYLFKYESVSLGQFEHHATSLEGCINLCAAYNAFNGTAGQAGPCVTVAWRTDPRYDHWAFCWGSGVPVKESTIEGKNATTEPGSDIPVDSAILMDYVST